ATIWSLVRKVTQADVDFDTVVLGGCLANYQHVVLDQNARQVPLGVNGELGIGGLSLAKGYLKRADLSNDRFVNLMINGQQQRVYLTGDLVKLDNNGQFDYLGRMDDQVKINGHRIEPGEIERQVQLVDGVKDVAVVVKEVNSGHYLACFFQPEAANSLSPAQLEHRVLSRISTVLPPYMLPKTFTVVAEFPLNTNGKIDKRVLAGAEVATEQAAYVEPKSDGELAAAKVWTAVLGKDKVGINDNFFALGGDSLLMVDLAANLNKLGLNVSIKQLLENQTIATLLQSIAARSTISDTDIVVKLNNNSGDDTPLFFAHPLTGSVYDLKSLAQALEPNMAVYAIQAPFLANQSSEFNDLRELAEYYFSEVKKIQPHGPYRFGGTSSGVQIAYQLAQLATEHGETVSALVSLDSLPFGLYDDVTRHIDAIGLTADLVMSKGYKTQLMDSCEHQKALEQRRLLVEMIKDSGQANYFNGVDIGQFVDFLVSYFLADSPKGPLSINGPTLHFGTLDNPNKQRMLDAWQGAVQTGFVVHDLPGDHDGLI
ncbi:MAG: thioesterase domain-containing protein, partial [Psychrosphaera sp.]|nr:thioesterase domain-containing protein [Psychrosphaera sp.]